MGPDDPRAALRRHKVGRNRAAKALMRLRRGDGADEALARAPTSNGRPNTLSSSVAQRGHALLGGLAKSRCRGRARCCPVKYPLGRRSRASGKERGDILDDVDAGIDLVAVVHDNTGELRAAVSGHVRIALQAPDVRWRWPHLRPAPRRRTADFMLSMETGTPRAATSAKIGCKRLISSSAETGLRAIGRWIPRRCR